MTHLHVHSNYSRYDGVSTVQELVDQAIAHGHKSLAVTNHGLDSMGDLFRFQQYALSKGVKPILGNESYLVEELVTMDGKKRKRTKNTHIILLASNETGWKNLCKLSYIANSDDVHFYYKPRITLNELFEHAAGLVVGTACLASIFSQYVLSGNEAKAEEYFKKFYDKFGENFYAEIQLNELKDEQKKYNDWIIATAAKYNVPVVITGDVHYATPEGAATQRFIFNLRKEDDSEGDDTYRCKSLFYQGVEDFKTFNKQWGYGYTDEQIEQWCANSDKIAEKCNFIIPLGTGMKLPRYSFDEEEDFVRLAKEGLANHFGCKYEGCPKEYKERLEHELEILLKKGAYRYMLTVASFVNHAREKKFMVGPSRGSCGGCLTALCLGIASWALDPLKLGLLFERFVSDDRLVSNTYKYYVGDWYITKNRKYSFEDLKKIVVEKIKEYPQYKDRAIKELRRAKWLENEMSVYDEIMEVECDDRYVLPFFLGRTDKVDLEKPLEIAQIKQGGSGGLDIDSDYEPMAKEELKQWLIEKYGQERVMGVGTYGTVGLASAIKDILRKCEVPFAESNNFCKELNDEVSFEENMENYRNNFPDLYRIYTAHKAYLDFTPRITGQIRQLGQHAGGVLILDEPVWNYVPVIHTKDGIASAFVESGAATELDELGIIKVDCLAITVLEVISNAIELVKEDIIKVRDKDGIIKIVPESYAETHEAEVLETGISKQELKDYLYCGMDYNDKQLYQQVNESQDNVFQFSGGTASGMIQRALPQNFDELTCLNALSRPGSSFSFDDFVRNGVGGSKYPDEVAKFLKDSHGCILFQEEIMRLVEYLSNGKVSGNYARGLLKKLGKANKKQEDIDAWNELVKIIKSEAQDKLTTREVDELTADLITLSAYSFNKSHASAYTYVACETLYMSRYFKQYFWAASLTYDATKNDALKDSINSAQKNGFKILPPDVNESDAHFTPISADTIRFGLNEVKGIGEKPIEGIIENRPYTSVIDCIIKNIETEGYTKRITNALICSGAFDEIIGTKRSRYDKLCTTFYERKKTKKTPELLMQLWEDCEEDVFDEDTTNEQYMEYEKAYLGGNFFHNIFSALGDKIQKLYERGLCLRSLQEVKEKNLPSAMCPVYAKNFMFKKDKNGNDMAFCEISDVNGENYRIPIFASYYQFCKERWHSDDLYLLSLYADDDGSIKFGSRRWIRDGEKIKRFVVPLGKYIQK